MVEETLVDETEVVEEVIEESVEIEEVSQEAKELETEKSTFEKLIDGINSVIDSVNNTEFNLLPNLGDKLESSETEAASEADGDLPKQEQIGLDSPDLLEVKAKQASIKSKVEAVLFLTEKPVTAFEIAIKAELDVEDVRKVLPQLIQEYESRDTSLYISTDEGYILQVKEEFSFITEEILPLEIKTGVLRTLSAIALREPAYQPDVVDMRGGGAYLHIHELIDMGLITKKKEGSTNVLRTTPLFSKYFKLSDNGLELQDILKATSSRRQKKKKKTEAE